MAPTFNIQKAFESVHERLNEIQEDTTASKTQLKALLGNGQPGKISLIEGNLKDLNEYKANAKGYLAALAAISTVLAGLLHFAIDLFRHK